jgi:hypothetical protein
MLNAAARGELAVRTALAGTDATATATATDCSSQKIENGVDTAGAAALVSALGVVL